MIHKTVWENGMAIVTYKFSDKDLEVLSHLKKHGFMEFRFGHMSDIADDLYDYGFVESNPDSWNYTIKLTALGKAVVENMN